MPLWATQGPRRQSSRHGCPCRILQGPPSTATSCAALGPAWFLTTCRRENWTGLRHRLRLGLCACDLLRKRGTLSASVVTFLAAIRALVDAAHQWRDCLPGASDVQATENL